MIQQDTEKIHWVLKDILGQGTTANTGSSVSNTKYFRVSLRFISFVLMSRQIKQNISYFESLRKQFDPKIGKQKEFPIDGTDPKNLERLYKLSTDHMNQPEQKENLNEIAKIIKGKRFFQ